MDRLLIALVVIAVVSVVAYVLERRKPQAPTQPQWAVPSQLDRADFDGPDLPWLVVVFTSSTCEACGPAMTRARVLASPSVAVQEVEAKERAALHRRYAVEAVPTVVVADADGIVRATFVGEPD